MKLEDIKLSDAQKWRISTDWRVPVCGAVATPEKLHLVPDGPSWFVFSLQFPNQTELRYFRQEGAGCWGTYVWDGALTEVYPETKTITVFTPNTPRAFVAKKEA
jgi:hypothetical protein